MALKQEEKDNFRKMKYGKNLLLRMRVYFRRFWRRLNAHQSGKIILKCCNYSLVISVKQTYHLIEK